MTKCEHDYKVDTTAGTLECDVCVRCGNVKNWRRSAAVNKTRLQEIEDRIRDFAKPRDHAMDGMCLELIAEVRRLRENERHLRRLSAVTQELEIRSDERRQCSDKVDAFNRARFGGRNPLLAEIAAAIRAPPDSEG